MSSNKRLLSREVRSRAASDDLADPARRHFLEAMAGLGVASLIAGCIDEDRLGPAANDDRTALAYPRGEGPSFEASPVAPFNPGLVDGGQVIDFAPGDLPLDTARFALGVQAGQMTADSVEIWTHIGDERPGRLRVWRELPDAPGKVALVRDLDLTPQDGGWLRSPVRGLAAGTVYRYAFFDVAADGAALVGRSAIGRVRTAFLEDGIGPLTIAATTCTHHDFRPFTSLERMADAEPDVVIHLGDLDYAEAFTLEEYRTKWRGALSDPQMQRYLQAAGLYMAWDDHEVADAWSADTIDPVQLENARQGFREAFPVFVDGTRLWTSYRWGRTAEFFVLDTRTDRRPSTRRRPDGLFLGLEQMAWLKQGLLDSRARFKLVLNSVPMANMQGMRAAFWAEQRWQGYQAQRRELIDFIVENDIRDVWFLSGDMHIGFVARLDRRGPDARLWEIAVGPGAQSVNNFVEQVARGVLPERDLYPPDMFRFWSASGKNATLLTLDPMAGTIRVRFVQGDSGEVLFDQELSQFD